MKGEFHSNDNLNKHFYSPLRSLQKWVIIS